MKALLFVLAFASLALAESKPECDYWAGRVSTLDVSIAVANDKLKACGSDCHDTEVLRDSYIRERAVTLEFLNDSFYGCAKKK